MRHTSFVSSLSGKRLLLKMREPLPVVAHLNRERHLSTHFLCAEVTGSETHYKVVLSSAAWLFLASTKP
jgi:hypothetical protein